MPQTNQILMETNSVVRNVDEHFDKILVVSSVPQSSMEFTLLTDESTVVVDSVMLPGTGPGAVVGFGFVVAEVPHDSIAVAVLPGGVGLGTWTNTRELDSSGAVMNSIQISQDAQPILATGEQVFGLLQCADGTVNGDLIGPPLTPNSRLAFYTGNFQEAQLPAGTYQFTPQQNLVDRLIPERVVFRVAGGGAISAPTYSTADLFTIQRGVVLGSVGDPLPPSYANNEIFVRIQGIVEAGTTRTLPPGYRHNELFSLDQKGIVASRILTEAPPVPVTGELYTRQQGIVVAGTSLSTKVGDWTIQQLTITAGQPEALTTDADEEVILIVNGLRYFPDLVAPGNTGAFWTLDTPTQIIWNEADDPNIFALSWLDSVVVQYR